MAHDKGFNARLKRAAAPRARRAARLYASGLTWAQVGQALGVSRQRAKQLADKAPK